MNIRTLLAIPFFVLVTFHLYSQPKRNWGTYEIKKRDFVEKVKHSPKKVEITFKTIEVDTCTDSGDRLERTITTVTTKLFSRDTTTTDKVESGNIRRYKNGKNELVLAVPGDPPLSPDISRVHIFDTLNAIGTIVTVKHPSKKVATLLTKGQRRSIYDRYYSIKYSLPRFFIGASYAALVGYRWIFVNDPEFNNQGVLDSRKQNESSSYSRAFHLQIGIAVRRVHHWYVEGSLMKQAFRSKNSIIDWNTGLPLNDASTSNTYRFFSSGAGLGYSYSGYRKIVNVVADFSLAAIFLYKYKDNVNPSITGRSKLASDPVTANLIRTGLMGKFGLGVNVRTFNHVSIRAVPTLYFNLTAINKEVLRTGLINFGVSAGVFLH